MYVVPEVFCKFYWKSCRKNKSDLFARLINPHSEIAPLRVEGNDAIRDVELRPVKLSFPRVTIWQKINRMTEKRLLDSEYEWIVRTCTNAFNIYLTMIHFIFYDNTLSLQPENFGNSEKSAERDREIGNATFLKFQKSRSYRTRYSWRRWISSRTAFISRSAKGENSGDTTNGVEGTR